CPPWMPCSSTRSSTTSANWPTPPSGSAAACCCCSPAKPPGPNHQSRFIVMELLTQYGTLFLVLACLFGFFMAWGVGANDVSNAMGTSVGSKAITIKQAILIAMVFEFLGAYLAGGEVTSTIRDGIIDPSALEDNPQYMVYGMLSALLAAGIWLLVASMKGWP